MRWPSNGEGKDDDDTPTVVRKIRAEVDSGRPSLTPLEAMAAVLDKRSRRGSTKTAFAVAAAFVVSAAATLIYLGGFQEKVEADHRAVEEIRETQTKTAEVLDKTGDVLIRIESKLGEVDRTVDRVEHEQKRVREQVEDLRDTVRRNR